MSFTEKELGGFRSKVIPEWLDYTLKKDYDRVILIVGKEGVGKSTLAILLGQLIINERNKRLNKNVKLEIKKTLYYNLRKLEEDVFTNSSAGDIRIIDEGAITGGYKRQAMTKDNKSLNETLMTCRSRNQILMFLIPSINEIDRGLLRRADTTIRVVRRGHAWCYHQNEAKVMVHWNPKYKRTEFKYRRKPYLHLEKFRDVPTILGQKVWNDYITHKENSLRDRHKKPSTKQLTDIKYRRPKDIMDMFGVKEHTIKKLAKADGVDKIRDTRGWLFNVDSVKSYINQQQPSTTRSEHIVGVNGREDAKK